MREKLRELLKPIIALFLICVIVTGALALTFNVTKDIIAKRALIDAENARKEVMANADNFKQIEDFENIQDDNSRLKIIKDIYIGLKNGEELGYVFLIKCKGYGGEMNVTVGIDGTRKVTGVKIGDNSETAGLGTKATDPEYLSQFKDISPKNPLRIVKGKKESQEEIIAVSGATITSTAITNAVQAALDMSLELEKGGSKGSE